MRRRSTIRGTPPRTRQPAANGPTAVGRGKEQQQERHHERPAKGPSPGAEHSCFGRAPESVRMPRQSVYRVLDTECSDGPEERSQHKDPANGIGRSVQDNDSADRREGNEDQRVQPIGHRVSECRNQHGRQRCSGPEEHGDPCCPASGCEPFSSKPRQAEREGGQMVFSWLHHNPSAIHTRSSADCQGKRGIPRYSAMDTVPERFRLSACGSPGTRIKMMLAAMTQR